MILQGVDALNRVTFDAAAHTLRTRSPITLPEIAPLTESEDWKHLDNLRQITSLLNGSTSSSGVGTVAGMGMGTGGPRAATNSSVNFRTTTQVYNPFIPNVE